MTVESPRRISKILIANRGEIACRIIRTCRAMNISTVAVYSDVDKSSLHVAMADEAVPLAGTTPAETYLRIDKILEAAASVGAEAIHPGYGFLSENPKFADAVRDAGLIFIGPSGDAIRKLGDKTSARNLARQCNIPTVPGSAGIVEDEAAAESAAREVGYPVLLKASAGGGGKGMRVVKNPQDCAASFRAARSEALSSFGDGRLYVERYLEHPRHIEIQVLADLHDHAIYFAERECSVQRRHQKVIEESPSTVVSPDMRRSMGEAAIRLIRSAGYVSTGTVEFIVDADRHFYFLEVNTRLQVEHPVTEMITGLDLVREQIRVAMGESLSVSQSEVPANGWAIECRICAEDPGNDFFPSTGVLEGLKLPSGPFVRVDSGFQNGGIVSIYYDSLLAKVITWGNAREEAIARLSSALSEATCSGILTNISFCGRVISHAAFRSGNFDTHFVADHEAELLRPELTPEMTEAAALASVLMIPDISSEKSLTQNATPSKNAWLDLRTENFR